MFDDSCGIAGGRFASRFPGFGILPGDVNGMVEVQQQSLPAVEKAEAEEVVVDECGQRADDNVNHAEPDFTFRHDHLRGQGRVAVHVVYVIRERGVGVVDDGMLQTPRC